MIVSDEWIAYINWLCLDHSTRVIYPYWSPPTVTSIIIVQWYPHVLNVTTSILSLGIPALKILQILIEPFRLSHHLILYFLFECHNGLSKIWLLAFACGSILFILFRIFCNYCLSVWLSLWTCAYTIRFRPLVLFLQHWMKNFSCLTNLVLIHWNHSKHLLR